MSVCFPLQVMKGRGRQFVPNLLWIREMVSQRWSSLLNEEIWYAKD